MSEILVGGDHVGLEASVVRAPHQGADDIVRLIAVAGEHRDIERLDHAADVGQCGAKFLGHLLPVGLVIGKLDVPLRRRLGIERDPQMSGLLVVPQVEQRLRKPIQRGAVHAFRRENRSADKREVRPIDQRHSVQQEQFLHHADSVARPGANSAMNFSSEISARSPNSAAQAARN